MPKAASIKPEKPQLETPQLPPKIPHPVDDLIKAEAVLDAKLKRFDPRNLKKLRRIAHLERAATGGEDW